MTDDDDDLPMTDEGRRAVALHLAADVIGAKDTDDASEIAEQFVRAARVFEAYLKGDAT